MDTAEQNKIIESEKQNPEAFRGGSGVPTELIPSAKVSIECMIDSLAKAHGVSKRIIEKEYTEWDYHIYILNGNLEKARESFTIKNNSENG